VAIGLLRIKLTRRPEKWTLKIGAGED